MRFKIYLESITSVSCPVGDPTSDNIDLPIAGGSNVDPFNFLNYSPDSYNNVVGNHVKKHIIGNSEEKINYKKKKKIKVSK